MASDITLDHAAMAHHALCCVTVLRTVLHPCAAKLCQFVLTALRLYRLHCRADPALCGLVPRISAEATKPLQPSSKTEWCTVVHGHVRLHLRLHSLHQHRGKTPKHLPLCAICARYVRIWICTDCITTVVKHQNVCLSAQSVLAPWQSITS